MVSLWNRSDIEFVVNIGDRIAQMIVVPVIQCDFQIVSEFAESSRGEGGFGHSGVK